MTTDHAARWAWLRAQTPVLRDLVYLNCGFQGPMSEPVAQAMRDWLDRELHEGPTARPLLEARRALATRYREVCAQLMGADPDEIAITDNTTDGINLVTAGLSVEHGDGVVTTGIEHASGIVPSYYLRERRGADLHIVPLSSDDSPGTMLEAFGRAIDARTRIVLISGVSYSTGQWLPVSEIVALAHRESAGSLVLIDGAQTGGHEPLDVHASGVDAYALPMHKWLCGPGGLGALYIRRDRIEDVEPQAVGGHAAASFDFDGGFVPERKSIQKFELTTVSGVLLAGGVAAVEQYLESGPQAVWDRVRALNVAAERRIGGIPGVTVTSPHTEGTRTGLFAFQVGDIDPAVLVSHLWLSAKVVCRSVREARCVRLSLAAYNTEDDIEVVARAVEAALAGNLHPDAAAAAAPPAGAPVREP
jgi:selenocysteine lyase/cysteine desulfurase